MKMEQLYEPLRIPKRKTIQIDEYADELRENDIDVIELTDEPFVEIEVTRQITECDEIRVPSAQAVEQDTDEKRTLFYSMRQIARESLQYYSSDARAFYHQAVFMVDVEDDYSENEPFSCYYPYYQQMGYAQLRTYFTWRTQVRKGNITNTSLSYVFLYTYELINNVGVTDSSEGLNKLVELWEAFREFDTSIDRYLAQWIKDYHVYYPLEQSFHEFVNSHNLRKYYPTVFAYESDRNDSFDLFADISKYNIKKSIFYSEQTHPLLNDCFYFILDRLREHCRKKKKLFEDFVCYPAKSESTWIPFNRGLFYSTLTQTDRDVIISDREVYICRNNRWTYKTVMLTDQGKQLIGYIMKEMESALRKFTGFRHKLSANPNMCDSKTWKRFENMGIPLTRFIGECVSEFNTQRTHREVRVDVINIHRIRAEAMDVQEKLIIPDNIEVNQVEPIQVKPTVIPQVSDVWVAFIETLTQIECKALKVLMQEKDIKEFAVKSGIMLEVLVDGINQKSVDCIGDTVLELDDTVVIYEDYKEELIKREWL